MSIEYVIPDKICYVSYSLLYPADDIRRPLGVVRRVVPYKEIKVEVEFLQRRFCHDLISENRSRRDSGWKLIVTALRVFFGSSNIRKNIINMHLLVRFFC